jgi:hypothetical protein
MSGRRTPAGVTFDPFLNMTLLELGHWQRAAVAAKVIEISNRGRPMALAQFAGRHAALAVLEVFGADSGHEPLFVGRIASLCPVGIGHFGLRECPLSSLLDPFAANTLPFAVEMRDPLLGARQRVISAIGLLPVPG